MAGREGVQPQAELLEGAGINGRRGGSTATAAGVCDVLSCADQEIETQS